MSRSTVWSPYVKRASWGRWLRSGFKTASGRSILSCASVCCDHDAVGEGEETDKNDHGARRRRQCSQKDSPEKLWKTADSVADCCRFLLEFGDQFVLIGLYFRDGRHRAESEEDPTSRWIFRFFLFGSVTQRRNAADVREYVGGQWICVDGEFMSAARIGDSNSESRIDSGL